MPPTATAIRRSTATTNSDPRGLNILREAAVHGGGDHLGEVGGRIVAEVIDGIIRTDPESYLTNDPSWRPTLPSNEPDSFKIRDLLVPAH